MVNARRKGRHLYSHDWRFPIEIATLDAVDAVLAWCRQTLAQCRRPFGIDHFDLLLTVSEPGERRPRRVEIEKLRIVELYQESLPERLASLLSRRSGASADGLAVSAAVFSWGDAAHEALPATW